MLIHDDMMDGGTQRRGRKTLEMIGRANAHATVRPLDHRSVQHLSTIIGDLLLTKSMDLLIDGATSLDTLGAIKPIMEGAYRAGAAQFEDIVGWNGLVDQSTGLDKNDTTLLSGVEANSVLSRLVIGKAAFHGFVSPLLAGLRLNETNAEVEDVCKDWGFRAGTAFQGLDDITDLTCSALETGKDQLQDIHECRLSLPLMILRSKASAEEWTEVQHFLTQSALYIPTRKLVFSLIDKYEIVDTLFEFIKNELNTADTIVSTKLNGQQHSTLAFGLNQFNKGLRNRKEQIETMHRSKGI